MKAHLKTEAIRLRKAGYSYSFIKQKIGVSKSTLTLWLSGMPYLPNQEVKNNMVKARLASSEAKHKLLRESLMEAETLAKKDIGTLSKRDLFMLGIGIYIGEGAKTAHVVRVVNSEVPILRFVIKWFMLSYGLKKENFRLRLHLYPDTNIEASEKYWLSQLDLKRSNLLFSQIDRRKDKRKDRRGKLPYGTAHLSIVSNGKKEFGVLLFRRILALISMVLEVNRGDLTRD
ncbi:MAG: hypothetical protein PHV93_00855 [Candidatus Pacebacteria bacterium]|nr:hypothetical protein [Candidatus Paceibacterota bacterium]